MLIRLVSHPMSFAESNTYPRRPTANPSDTLTSSRRNAHTTVVTASSSTPSTTLENGSRDIIANASNNTPLLRSRPSEPRNTSESVPILTKPTINSHLLNRSDFGTRTLLTSSAGSSGLRRPAASPITPTSFEEEPRGWWTDRRATPVQTTDARQGSGSVPAFPVGFAPSSRHSIEKINQFTPVPQASSSRSSTSMLSSRSLRSAADFIAPRAVASSSPASQLPGETSSPSHKSSRRPPGRHEEVASGMKSESFKSHNMNDPVPTTIITTSESPSNSRTSSELNPTPNYKPPLLQPSILRQDSRLPSSTPSTTMSTPSLSLRMPRVRGETLPEHKSSSHPNASTFGKTASANILSSRQASTPNSRSLSLPSLSSTTTSSSLGASAPSQTPPSSLPSSSTTSSPHSRKASGDLLPNHTHESRTKPTSSSPALDAIPHKLALDDMKRLLSKPASILSGSDSDGYRSLGRSGNRTVVSSDDDVGGGGYRSSPGRLNTQVRERLGVRAGATSEGDEDHSFLSLGHTLPLPTSTAVTQNSSTDKRAKNVLRRRPSNGAKAPNPAIFPASYTEAKLKPRTRVASRSRSLSTSPLPRHPPSGNDVDTSGLTPARAVAMAYKQQQLEGLRRQKEEEEKVKKESDVSTSPPSSSGSSTDHATPKVSNTPEASTSHLPDNTVSSSSSPSLAPYYTVFGSTSGKVIAVGGPEDSWSEYSLGPQLVNGLGSGIGHRTASVSVGKPRTSKSLSRSLSRKLSGRWRKGSMGVPDDDMEWEKIELPSVDREREKDLEPGQGRPSLQERRGHRKPVLNGSKTEETKYLRVSVDTQAGPIDEPTMPASKTPRTATPAKDASFDSAFNNVLGPWKSETKSEPGSGGGKKLWKLIKRISTSGLRDKFLDSPSDSPSSSPPPVPALPKDYASMNYGPKSMDGHGSAPQAGALSRIMQTRTSISGGRPSQSPKEGPAIRPLHPVPATSSNSLRGHRPSITTRSSSPGSSDVASSKFFQRTQSQRSSSSSYGDEVPPPVPDTVVGQHIIPPSELYKLTKNMPAEEDDSKFRHRKSLSKVVQHSVRTSTSSLESWVPTAEGPLPSLPTPPRTAWKPPNDSVRASPTIPEFSTSAPINAFIGRRPSAVESASTDIAADLKSTPSRTSRSLHRLSPSASKISSPIRRLPSIPRLSSPPPIPDTPTNPNRTSTSSHATARPRSYASTLTTSPSPTAQFRDRATIKPAWTEQEKTDMWNDLLERSARAGGTLHLRGDHGLASDQLRFSAATVSDSEVE
ncbi:uncharacterized protein BT62DRAFT_1076861 [Guyanagaster necrorhizus]|uniref:Uncharacterized protein n=1 Tax=Guyanagaster necrorhizus TaxID=856835 RepID=A0A9P8AS63_9AGAR|nr:uncharacterized protein BT62DRAFT_1076861 [Guyanagaster necrorhizus MCA 3950]KAG7445790.1 hypothetical protein BT62DRAFT_1076861 [Guyanagaster necrorhizus MCA 3950]